MPLPTFTGCCEQRLKVVCVAAKLGTARASSAEREVRMELPNIVDFYFIFWAVV